MDLDLSQSAELSVAAFVLALDAANHTWMFVVAWPGSWEDVTHACVLLNYTEVTSPLVGVVLCFFEGDCFSPSADGHCFSPFFVDRVRC